MKRFIWLLPTFLVLFCPRLFAALTILFCAGFPLSAQEIAGQAGNDALSPPSVALPAATAITSAKPPGSPHVLPGNDRASLDSLLIVFWNVENLFDCDGSNGGAEWTPEGSKHWTPYRLRAKCNAIGKTLLWIGEQWGMRPDIVALAEVENAAVLKRLIYSDVLRKCGYGFLHFDSPDRRGIDVAVLFRKERFCLVGDAPDSPEIRPYAEPLSIPGFRTRDILKCHFPLPTGIAGQAGNDGSPALSGPITPGSTRVLPGCDRASDTLTLLVNHHPSKLGGTGHSSDKREAAMRVLRDACLRSVPLSDTCSPQRSSRFTDSLSSQNPHTPHFASGESLSPHRRHARPLTIATGDFNDTPDGAPFHLLDSLMVCLSLPLHRRGEGTLKYDGRWELIDHFWVSPDLAPSIQPATSTNAPAASATPFRCTTAIVRAPFLLTRDSTHSGDKPLRTYSGPRYLGGVSDHLPIVLKLYL